MRMAVSRRDGEIDHRDVFLSEDQKQEASRLCACVSRVCGGGIVLDSAVARSTAGMPLRLRS